jgi:hypothetical protein
MDKELGKRLDKLIDQQKRTNVLLEALLKRADPNHAEDVQKQLREALQEKPKGLYDGVGAFLE